MGPFLFFVAFIVLFCYLFNYFVKLNKKSISQHIINQKNYESQHLAKMMKQESKIANQPQKNNDDRRQIELEKQQLKQRKIEIQNLIKKENEKQRVIEEREQGSASKIKPFNIDDLFVDSKTVTLIDKTIDELSYVDRLNGFLFEEYVAQLLKNNGFDKAKQTVKSGDFGIDVIAEKDGVKYGFQCKLYSGNVGYKAVQEALSGDKYYSMKYGVVLTNQYFTDSAIDAAEKFGITLWDRTDLKKLIINNFKLGNESIIDQYNFEFQAKSQKNVAKNVADNSVDKSHREEYNDQPKKSNHQYDDSIWNKMALKSAKEWLDTDSISKKQLENYLADDKFDEEQISYALNNIGNVNWNEMALKSAKEYLQVSSYSKDRLKSTLSDDGFTDQQIFYAMNNL